MIIGVMSDSHDNLDAVAKALEVFRKGGVEAIIHLGDVISPFTLMKILEYPGKIMVVLGNNDGDAITLKELASKAGATLKREVHQIEVSGKRFFLMHGFGDAEQTKAVAEAMALTGRYDVVLYGHTHKVDMRQIGKTLVLNPGEVCGYLTNRRTVAILNTETLEYNIVEF